MLRQEDLVVQVGFSVLVYIYIYRYIYIYICIYTYVCVRCVCVYGAGQRTQLCLANLGHRIAWWGGLVSR